jgi:beta-glucosidase
MKYKDKNLPIDERVKDLLGRMTLEEKIGQLNQPVGVKSWQRDGSQLSITEEFKKLIADHGIGSLYGVLRADPWTGVTLETGLSPREGAEAINMIQRFAIENTRLGIPLLFTEECSHGHMAIGSTTFPVPLAMGSTWNPDLMRRIMQATAAETRAQGCTQTLSPIVDVSREPRWGRTEETFGEDPFLCSVMGAAAVEGLQGESLNTNQTIAATLKHFVHGMPEAGRNTAPSHTGPRELREVFLAPFKAGVKAGARCVMSSYNEIDGVPCSANRELLTTILREEWGFDGYVISDLGSVEQLHVPHFIAENLSMAAAKALLAGVDVELGAVAYREPLLQAVHNGIVSEEMIDQAVARLLRLKFALGLFENPYGDPDLAERIVGCQAHKDLARQAARECIVLLKNERDLLPLPKDLKSIAVIGPNAANAYNLLGDYTSPQMFGKVVTILDGIKAKVSPNTVVRYARGCGIRDTSRKGFEEAVKIARESDVAIVAVGGTSARGFGPDVFDPVSGAALPGACLESDLECGEGLDRASLDLAGVQMDLVKEICATGTPVVVVLVNGRPYSINWIAQNVPAIIEAWYPGEQGGNGVADVLFGDYNPAGRLPISIPKSVGQLPIYYSARRSARQNPYVDMDGDPLYPFGFGLSYTKFEYSNLRLSSSEIRIGETATVSVDVTNVGGVAGDEVVQLYIRDNIASVTRPMKELKGFQRLHFQPGETKTVSFSITPEMLQILDLDMQWRVEPGIFTIMVGPNSIDLAEILLEVKD